MATHTENQSAVFDRSLILPLLFAVLIGTLYFSSVVGPRGTDQYWYLHDTETLIESGTSETNLRLPGMILRQGVGDPKTYFIHNGPLLSINAALGEFTGAFYAWKYSNFLFLILASLFTGLAVGYLTNVRLGAAAFSVYLLSPTAIWYAGNLLQETFFALITSALLLLFVRWRSERWAEFGIVMLLCLGITAHPFYLLLSGAFVLYLLCAKKFGWAGILYVTMFGICANYKTTWFPASFQPDLASIITSSLPGETNMLWHFSAQTPPLTLNLLLLKLGEALRMQLATIAFAPFYLITNLGFISFLYLALKKRTEYQPVLMISFLAFGAYAGMIVLMQNQPRYQLIIAPISVLCIALVFRDVVWSKNIKILYSFGVICLFALDAYLLNKIHDDAVKEKQALAKIFEEFPDTRADDKFLMVGGNPNDYLSVIAGLSPKRCLLMDAKYLSDKEIESVVNMFIPSYVLSTEKALSLGLAEVSTYKFTNNALYYELYLHKVDLRNSAVGI